MGSVQIKLLNDKLEEIHNLIDEGDEKLDEQNADAAEKKFKEANTLFGEIKPEIQRLREPEYLNQIIEIEETLDDRRAAVAEMRGMSPQGRSTDDGSSKRGVRFAGVPSSNEDSSDESGSGFSEESSDRELRFTGQIPGKQRWHLGEDATRNGGSVVRWRSGD
eukprot:GEMP01082792.1.p1 GENE.GEMP01082792.1~~GEMP01082792.1.p1  ORF type:complete len:163 (+),score=32.59 GEMP01082792.1:318-806(+)